MYIYSPLEQFIITPIFNDILTNFSLTTIWVILTILYFILGSISNKIKSNNNWIIFLRKLIYTFYIMTKTQIKYRNSNYSYFGLIISIFIFIMVINLLGMIPFSYTLTAQFIITFGLSVPIFLTMTFEAFKRHGLKFLSFFIPNGAPIALLPLIAIIELISFIARVFSLAIRLAANLLAGHILLKIFATGVLELILMSFMSQIISIFPFILLMLFIILELGVALIQSYVFVLLTSCYLADAIDNH